MESVEAAVHFSQKSRICHTFELPSGNWLQHCSAQTSRWHKGSTQQCKLARRKCWGSVQQVCSEAECEAKNISFQCFQMFIYLPDWTHRGCPWLLVQIVTMEMTIYHGSCNIFKLTLKTNWLLKSHKFIPILHLLRIFFTSLSTHLRWVSCNLLISLPRPHAQVSVVRSVVKQPDSS